jgi:hypothetical protein
MSEPLTLRLWSDLEAAVRRHGSFSDETKTWVGHFHEAEPTTTPSPSSFEYRFDYMEDGAVAEILRLTDATLYLPSLMKSKQWFCTTTNEYISTLDDIKCCRNAVIGRGVNSALFCAVDAARVKKTAASTTNWFQACFVVAFGICCCYGSTAACTRIALLSVCLYVITYVPAACRWAWKFDTRLCMVMRMSLLGLGCWWHVWGVCAKHEWETKAALKELLATAK